MPHIISLQSHVAYGHAGNSAAIFPMQRLGMQVTDVNLISLSNHLGHPTWRGDTLSDKQLSELLQGLDDLDILKEVNCIVSGYIASETQVRIIAEFVSKAKQTNPHLIYCCDPVIGDDHMGVYVQHGVAETIRDLLVPIADIITPNKFEFSYLTGQEFHNLETMQIACEQFHQQHKKTITLLTSFSDQEDEVGMLMLTQAMSYQINTPKYTLPRTAVGSGDVTTALFISHYLNGDNAATALEKTANAMHTIAKYTFDHKLPELGIIQCQESIASPCSEFRVTEPTIEKCS